MKRRLLVSAVLSVLLLAACDEFGTSVAISGTQPTTGCPIGGLGTVRLDAGDSVDVPVMIAVPDSSDTGDYTLIPAVYKREDYLAGYPQAIGSGFTF